MTRVMSWRGSRVLRAVVSDNRTPSLPALYKLLAYDSEVFNKHDQILFTQCKATARPLKLHALQLTLCCCLASKAGCL